MVRVRWERPETVSTQAGQSDALSAWRNVANNSHTALTVSTSPRPPSPPGMSEIFPKWSESV